MNSILKRFGLFGLVVALATGFASCNNDDDREPYWASYGVVRETQESYDIVRDDGKVLYVEVNQSNQRVEDGQRVLANYAILGDEPDGFRVKLYALYDVLTKKPVSQSFIDADKLHRTDSIGVDPIITNDAWFGGNFLNVYFTILHSNSSQQHFINLVYDDLKSTADELFFELKHNDYDDPRRMYGTGVVSFDLSGLMPAGRDKVKVTLTWTDYDGYVHSISGDYVPGTSQPVPSSLSVAGQLQLSVQ
ncbi:MAG: NigD-like N-terminal domain-containing protein [Rikenellaceae bacterium]|nr:NigD-like N-terminal domain-containing protein [Rikenellaceae bacterium]